MVYTDILSIEVQMSDEGRTIVDDVGDLCPNTTSPFSSATATTSNWYSVEFINSLPAGLKSNNLLHTV